MIARSAAVRDARLAQLGERERQVAEKRREANAKVLEGLRMEREELVQTDRRRTIGQALKRLSAEATDGERRAVEDLAGALYDEREAIEARDRLMEKGRSLIESLRTESEKYAAEIAELNQLLEAGAIDQETYARAMEETRDRMLRASREWADGVNRALRDYADEATDAAEAAEEVTTVAFQGMEDALVQFASTGKVEFQSLADSIMADITRIAVRQTITGPLAGILGGSTGGVSGGLFGGGGGPSGGGIGGLFGGGFDLFGLFHRGGIVGKAPKAVRSVDPAVFADAPRFHSGGFAGLGLLPEEVPIIARKGELVVPPERIVRKETRNRDGAPITVVINVRANDAGSFRASQGQIAAEMARAVDRARRNM